MIPNFSVTLKVRERKYRLRDTVKGLWFGNLSLANILRCLQLDGWHLLSTQLKNLRLHQELRLLMGTASTPEAKLEATMLAEIYFHEHLVSGQAIHYGRYYTLANIRLSSIFISQIVGQLCSQYF